MRICCVCGARPNFVKIAAVINAMKPHPQLQPFIVHTGQHYDEQMYKVMFDDLALPRPNIDLEVGSASHALQTAEIMRRFEAVAIREKPDLVMVVGDVNSTVACSLVSVKLGIPVAHVEAGLRSFDRSMPEEINRVVTDAICEILLASEPSGVENLLREGHAEEQIFFVGNVMIDTLLRHREQSERSRVLEDLSVDSKQYVVLTLHRPSNVDDRQTLERLLAVLDEIQRELPIVFPAHPRTMDRLRGFGLLGRVDSMSAVRLTAPLGYLDFLKLIAHARVILTDSGGIQEESTVLRVPCLTLRTNTERPVTVESGFNQIVGSDPSTIRDGFRRALERKVAESSPPQKWDGKAGQRIVAILLEWYRQQLGQRGVPAVKSDSGSWLS